MCSRWICGVCGTVGELSVQQVVCVVFVCVCGTVGGVSVLQVALCWVWESWGCDWAAGDFVVCVFGIVWSGFRGVSVQ